MKNKRNNLIIESIKMIKMYYRTYTFLSVTIVISLSAFFTFLLYNDSKVYNEYKEVMGTSDKIGMIQFFDDSNIAQTVQAIEQIEDVNYYYYYTQQLTVGNHQNAEIHCNLNIVPSSIFAFCHNINNVMVKEDGQTKINLDKGEIAISENLYKCIEGQKDKDGELYIDMDIHIDNGEYRTYRFHVVNILQEVNEKPYLLDDKLVVYSDAIVSESNFEDVKIQSVEKKMTIYADRPQTVSQKLEKIDVNLDMVYTHKQEMNEAFINASNIKKTLCIALLFLLGINLYSSFNNALNERKYEIAIRRAIGAKRRFIILQMFLESTMVMVLDILISIYIGFIFIEMYKIYYYYKYHIDWIVYINKYSIAIFVCCSVFLSIVFAIIFAVKSTMVEVNKYIKGE